MPKLFTFSAESIELGLEVETLLRSKNLIFMDFSSSAYIRSEGIHAIMLELIAKQQSSQSHVAEILTSEKLAVQAQLEKAINEVQVLRVELNGARNEVGAMRKHVDDSSKIIESLRSENLHLNALAKAQDITPPISAADPALRENYQRLQLAFQDLRSQNIEAIASLKVLEDENEDLRTELEALKGQAKAVCKA
jgi:hypothetical protein